MNFLMLRGEVPRDRNTQEIVFDRIEDVDDMWTQLFFAMLNHDDYGELWYWGGNRAKRFALNFVERWTQPFHQYGPKHPKALDPDFIPDVIFCRGGFKEYHPILERFPKAIKIYYGAGRRFLPQPGFYNYDIILQDSPEQVEICKTMFPKALTTLFIKPAADNIFYPMPEVEEEYDVCFPANSAQAFKGHKFIYSTVPKDIKLLNLGNNPRGYKYPNNVTSYRVVRPEMAKHIAKCKVGIVAVESEIDSCPRVIPELLACGLPIIVLEGVRFWKDKYVKSVHDDSVMNPTGEMATKENFWDAVRFMLKYKYYYEPSLYYKRNLSLQIAAGFIREKIRELLK